MMKMQDELQQMLAIQMQQLNVSSLDELEEKVGPENK